MERHFDQSLNELQDILLDMGSYVKKCVKLCGECILQKTTEHIKEIHDLETKINQCHIEIDDRCVKLLALQQPLAADLRMIIAIIKINTDLERMGDQTVNIAHNTELYLSEPEIKPLIDLPQMFVEVRKMVKESLDSFVKKDEPLARLVLKHDDIVDSLKNKIFKDILVLMKTKPEALEQGMRLILIARNLERIGDHATNIAEDVIFAITGEDIRHGSKISTLKEALNG